MRRPAEAVTILVGAVLALLVAFGVNLTDDQIAAILALVAALPAAITYLVSHSRNR